MIKEVKYKICKLSNHKLDICWYCKLPLSEKLVNVIPAIIGIAVGTEILEATRDIINDKKKRTRKRKRSKNK